MAWQDKGRKAAMGQFVRAKAERMVLIRFVGEPKETKGKNFQGQEVDELHFPVDFWDERSVALKYKEGEAARMVMSSKGEAKVFPVSSPPLMRALLEEDEDESIMGRTFILSHTGTAKDTTYKFREIKVPRQAQIVGDSRDEEPEEAEPQAIEGADEQDAIEEKHFEEQAAKRTRTRKPKTSKPEEVPKTEKEKFKEKVKAHAEHAKELEDAEEA